MSAQNREIPSQLVVSMETNKAAAYVEQGKARPSTQEDLDTTAHKDLMPGQAHITIDSALVRTLGDYTQLEREVENARKS